MKKGDVGMAKRFSKKYGNKGRAFKYSGVSEKRTLWDQYKFKWFVHCIESVLY